MPKSKVRKKKPHPTVSTSVHLVDILGPPGLEFIDTPCCGPVMLSEFQRFDALDLSSFHGAR